MVDAIVGMDPPTRRWFFLFPKHPTPISLTKPNLSNPHTRNGGTSFMVKIDKQDLSSSVEVDSVLADDGLAPSRLRMRRKLFDTLLLGSSGDEGLRELKRVRVRVPVL